ncbi:MAG: 50S ribosomal protein L25 [Candidatus Aminicenantes bacterium]|nr:50S ribosomal protein L25 [Candidatus Aminicenantes bacterium]
MNIVVKTEKRQDLGSNASRRLRARGLVPAVLYGGSMASMPLVLDKNDVVRIMRLETGENTIFKVAIGADEYDVMIKDMQVDPASDELVHVDLVSISMDKPIRVTVPVVHRGEPVGVKTEGGFIDFATREVEIECLPRDIPESLSIDISGLHTQQSFKVGAMAVPAGIKVLTEPDTVLVLISVPHKEEEFPGEKPEEEGAAEGAEEPEVIKKERAEPEETEK